MSLGVSQHQDATSRWCCLADDGRSTTPAHADLLKQTADGPSTAATSVVKHGRIKYVGEASVLPFPPPESDSDLFELGTVQLGCEVGLEQYCLMRFKVKQYIVSGCRVCRLWEEAPHVLSNAGGDTTEDRVRHTQHVSRKLGMTWYTLP